jgi:hypothetical protein
MAGNEQEQRQPLRRIDLRLVTRRKLILGAGVLLLLTLGCFGAIVLMLQQIESRTASFQPPMTALERESLLPPEPGLNVSTPIEGLHYLEDAPEHADPYPSLSDKQAVGSALLSHTHSLGDEPLNTKNQRLDLMRP